MILALGLAWVALFGGPGADQLNAVATMPDGGAVAVGNVTGDAVVVRYDPGGALVWQRTLVGSAFEDARAVAVAPDGSVLVTGYTHSTNFPASSVLRGRSDGFVAKLSPAGAVSWCVLLGGTLHDWPSAIAVDAAGNALVAGFTESTNFPTTAAALKRTRTPYFTDVLDGFVVKLSPAGAVAWSTYLGSATASDAILGLALDSTGRPTITGWTFSTNFPVTAGAYDHTANFYKEGFVSKLNAAGSALVFSTYLGGGNADEPRAIDVDAQGAVSVVGFTASASFPTLGATQPFHAGGTWDGFWTVLNPGGTALVRSTYVGTSAVDKLQDVAGGLIVGESGGQAWIAGERIGAGVAYGAHGEYVVGRATGTFQGQAASGASDGFILRLAAPTGFSERLADVPTFAAAPEPRERLVDLQGRIVHGRPPPGVYFRVRDGQRAGKVVVLR